MTFSICVREPYESDDGTEHLRFGVAVTTRLPTVGTLCPFVSENGAVATQSLVNVELGRKGVQYLDDGLAVEDALQALLNADDGSAQRQLHGVGADGEFVFSGEECKPWFGHTSGDGYTVAGNLLAGESVIEATEAAYVETAPPHDGSGDSQPLAERLIDALAAGQNEGGDKREELHVQSAALVVDTTEDGPLDPFYNNLRVDATETPIEDLRDTYELAAQGFEMAMDRYEDAYEADDVSEVEQEDEASD